MYTMGQRKSPDRSGHRRSPDMLGSAYTGHSKSPDASGRNVDPQSISRLTLGSEQQITSELIDV